MRKLLGCLSLAAKYFIYICGFVCIFIITTQDGIWRALGLGKKGFGERFRENSSCLCWASQLRNAEPFASSIDWLLCMSIPGLECGRALYNDDDSNVALVDLWMVLLKLFQEAGMCERQKKSVFSQ